MKKKTGLFDLHVPRRLIDEALAACRKKDKEAMEWRQCEVSGCSRWYQIDGVGNSDSSIVLDVVAFASESCGIHSIGLFEKRWACKECSGQPNGRFLAKNEHLTPPVVKLEDPPLPCDWCRDQGRSACDPGDHDQDTWDGDSHGLDENTDIVAQGVKLPPRWVSGVRTKSTTGQSYKIFHFTCSGCGDTLQLDRLDKFLHHMNQRTSKHQQAPRKCILPEMDHLLIPLVDSSSLVAEGGEEEEGAGQRAASDHPSCSVAGSSDLLRVFKEQGIGDLGRMATQIHMKLAGVLAECGDVLGSPSGGGGGGGGGEDWMSCLSSEAREILSSVRFPTHASKIIAGARELFEQTRVGKDGMFMIAKRSKKRVEEDGAVDGSDHDSDVFIVEEEEGDYEDGEWKQEDKEEEEEVAWEEEDVMEMEEGLVGRKKRRKMSQPAAALNPLISFAAAAATAAANGVASTSMGSGRGKEKERKQRTLDQCWSPLGSKQQPSNHKPLQSSLIPQHPQHPQHPRPLPMPSDASAELNAEREKRISAEAELRTANESLKLLGQQIDQAHAWILQVNSAPNKTLEHTVEALKLFEEHMVQLRSWSIQINQTARQL